MAHRASRAERKAPLTGAVRDYAQRVDRDAIERRDFPVGRRGYEQTAVDEHLRRVADEMERLRGRRPPAPPAPLAAGASEQVRLILEAAETSAAELRADAGRRTSEHVAEVRGATTSMLARLDDLERELGTLLDALRASGERLNEGLARLHDQTGELGAAAAAPPEEVTAADEAPAPAADAVVAGDGDEAGARLIALNMALSGTPREETARYLAQNFDLADANALLDDVYQRAGM
jgi:DivIVA domain-containing protein